jgi:hypothetical protein
MPGDHEAELIAQQLKHTLDLLRFDIKQIKAEQEHQRELYDHVLQELEGNSGDHEQRIRSLQDDVTRSKSIYNLASGGSTFMSLIALLRTFFLLSP